MDKATDIADIIKQVHNDSKSHKHHRYLSWEHCYLFFGEEKNKNDLDLSALHLSFYLASWGMMRGSSFLLQNDYRVNIPIVEKIFSEEFYCLREISFEDFAGGNIKEVLIKKTFDLRGCIREVYMKHADVSNTDNKIATDTLVTKIMLGTLACLPAYDEYFKAGLRKVGLPHSTFSENSLSKMLDFCLENQSTFDEIQEDLPLIKYKEERYPLMKLVDMYFFRLGGGE